MKGWWWFGVLVAAVIGRASGGDVTYDGRSLIIGGERKLLFSGSIHYPRSTPDMWPSLISKAKAGGLDAIDTYVFWNRHEPQPGQYDFSGRNDIVGFIKAVQAQGLYVCLRIGPFVEAEWNYGLFKFLRDGEKILNYVCYPFDINLCNGNFDSRGIPFWLHDVLGIQFRTNNEQFQFYMQNFTTKIVNIMKEEKLYASQGGPIVISQIENEYQNIERSYPDHGQAYVHWAAEMAVALNTGVPWIMCKQDDAPDPVINTCNGRTCGETFVGPNSPNKPALWTENWTHFLDLYGNITRVRSAEDIAYNTALFITKKNGSYINYYMYHGGTNFGRTSAAFIITSYYDQAPLDEYGLIRQPKWGHLQRLHAAVKQCSHAILYGVQTNFSLGALQEAYVYHGDSGECAAFLLNTDSRRDAEVQFMNGAYKLPRNSISILPDCKTVIFNTAQVNSQPNTRSMQPNVNLNSADKWQQWNEVIPTFETSSISSEFLLEQMSTTKDASDYLWYTASYEQSEESESTLTVESLGHALRVFVNGVLVGHTHGTYANQGFTLQTDAPLRNGVNNISLLSIMVGLPDNGAHLERRSAGLTTVSLQENQVVKKFTYSWGYQVGLVGEKLQLYTAEGSNAVQWSNFDSSSTPLTWYKSKFDAPEGINPVVLNLKSMGKGEVWINGQSIGRYWISFLTPNGSPSQTWYHIPRSFLKPQDNDLVLFDEEGGNPLGISIDTVSSPPPLVSQWETETPKQNKNKNHMKRPKVQLQ